MDGIGLTHAHMECRFLEETVPVLTHLLGFEEVATGDDQLTLRHPNTDWLMVVHQAGADTPDKQMHNHYGVRVLTNGEVDAAYEYLNAHKEEFKLKQVGVPNFSHGSYSLYFLEPGTNGMEIECYETVLRKEREWGRLGGVHAPHWESPLAPERFPGRGYVPQGFTHGTLASSDIKVSEAFYRNALGLKTYRSYANVRYTKHPATKGFVVTAVRKEWRNYSENYRFTLTLESERVVLDKHRWLGDHAKKVGLSELGEIRDGNPAVSFLLRDVDRNCWEISSPDDS